jgi:hypothetical protein
MCEKKEKRKRADGVPSFFLGWAGAWRGMNTPVPAHSRFAPGGVRNMPRMTAADAGGFWSEGNADELRHGGAPKPEVRWASHGYTPHAAAAAARSCCSRCCFKAWHWSHRNIQRQRSIDKTRSRVRCDLRQRDSHEQPESAAEAGSAGSC